MNWLNALLAFSITMLLMSMVVTVFVETIHRFVKLREKGLRLMLGHYFDRELSRHLDRAGYVATSVRAAFLDLMTVNRSPSGAAGRDRDFKSNRLDQDYGLIGHLWSGRRLASLDVTEFMARLGSSEFGEAIRSNIAQRAGIVADEVLKDIAQKFDAFGREAGQYFEARARLLSILVAILVAWGMYVHPYELLTTYLRDPVITQSVIDMEKDVTETYAEKRKAADEAAKELAQAEKEQETAQQQYEDALANKNVDSTQPKGETAPTAANPAKDHLDEKKKALISAREKWRAALIEAKATIQPLEDIGVPIGWTRERLAAANFGASIAPWFPLPLPNEWNAMTITTLCWLLLGGLLVGLGGPVWFDVVKSLSSIRNVLGAARPVASDEDKKALAVGTTAQPVTAVDHFKTASAGRAVTHGGLASPPEDEPAVG
jgi:hypothetical protein